MLSRTGSHWIKVAIDLGILDAGAICEAVAALGALCRRAINLDELRTIAIRAERAVNRREQMISDGYQQPRIWTTGSAHPAKQPIELPMDLTLDIEIRKAGDDKDEAA